MSAAARKDNAETQRTRLRLLSCNILAGGSVGGYRHYVTQSWKHVLPTRSKRGNLDNFARLLEEFDIVGLQEADAGSLRSGFVNQTEYLAESAGFPYWSHQPNRKIAQFAASSNGLLTRFRPAEVLDYPLPGRIPGRGTLWIRYGNGDDALIVLVAHLSLGPAARRRQFAFLAELIDQRPHVILMGDLNCPLHSAELGFLFDATSLQPPAHAAPATYPSWRPRRAIDHILTTKSIRVERLWTLEHAVSDHLPLAADVMVPEAIAPA